MEDFTKALTFEIKKDIADRYFGFRKRIETESNQYLEKLQTAGKEKTGEIIADVERMHCLLRKDDLFRSFIDFTGLPEALTSSMACSMACSTVNPQCPSQWQMLFAGQKGKGLTRRRRYRNLVYSIYSSLADKIAAYRDIFMRLEEEHEDICKEIDSFYRKNDLSGILNFLREIDNPGGFHSGILQADRASLAGRDMDQELRIKPPPPVTSRMHSLAQPPPLQQAKSALDRLLNQAFPLFDHSEPRRRPF
jgi:hypothetical protein